MRHQLRLCILPLLIMLAACATSSPQALQHTIDRTSTWSLWYEYGRSSDLVALQLIELELISRGELRSAAQYVGGRTTSLIGKPRYDRTSQSGSTQSRATGRDTYNCRDFPTGAAAQRAFLQGGGPVHDPNNLDADGDGFACEWGTDIAQIATTQRRAINRAAARTTSARTYSSARRCYTGPRGGTYTLTASGRKNYGGC